MCACVSTREAPPPTGLAARLLDNNNNNNNNNNINDDIVFGAVAFVRRGREELFFESVRTHRSFVRDALESERDDVFRDSI